MTNFNRACPAIQKGQGDKYRIRLARPNYQRDNIKVQLGQTSPENWYLIVIKTIQTIFSVITKVKR